MAKYEPAVRSPVTRIGRLRSGKAATNFAPRLRTSKWVRSCDRNAAGILGWRAANAIGIPALSRLRSREIGLAASGPFASCSRVLRTTATTANSNLARHFDNRRAEIVEYAPLAWRVASATFV